MARCPFATWHPVKFVGRLDRMTGNNPRAVFLHTNGGGPHLTSWFDQLWDGSHKRLGCTFQVFADGTIDQLCETNQIIYAQFSASEWAVSIETQDDNHPSRPWTKPQIDSIVRLLQWLQTTHGIPLKLMSQSTDSGIGYHQQFATFNHNGHDCPGPVRVSQLVHTILPRVSGTPAHDGHSGEDVHGHVPQHMKPLPLPLDKQSVDTRTWQMQMLARGWRGIGTANGVFGDKAQKVCRAFQAEKGLPVTGAVDEATWAMTWSAPITP